MELERWGWGGWVGAREMLGTCGEDDVIVTFFVIRKGFYFLFIFCYFCKNSYRRLLRLIL